jgi:hypothetical protein
VKLFKISLQSRETNLSDFLKDLKNVVSNYLDKIKKENKEDGQKIEKYFNSIDRKVNLNDNEIKELLTLVYKYKIFIPLEERRMIEESYKEEATVAGKREHPVSKILKNNYNFDLESFARETVSEKVHRFLEKETPGYVISLFAGPPIGFIGYGLQRYMSVPNILTHGTMGLLSLGTSYLTELMHEDVKKYPSIFSWEHFKSRWGHIGAKTLISYLGAHATKKILEDINKPEEML